MNSFLGRKRPVLTLMLRNTVTPEKTLEAIRLGMEKNPDAFGFQLEMLEPQYRTRRILTEFFDAMGDKPAYVTDYRRGNGDPPPSDDKIAEELLLALECGAKLIDVRGDMFDVSPEELTVQVAAVEKQKALIRQIHQLGGEALMSSHVLKFIRSERVLEIARAQAERGADIAKIVTAADSEEELTANLEATVLLRREMKVPTLFLCNGSCCALHRRLGPALGSYLYLCINDTDEQVTINQPQIHIAKAILRDAGFPNVPD